MKTPSLTFFASNVHSCVKPETASSTMSQYQQSNLERNFEAWRADRCPDVKISTAFETYCVEQILKDKEPSLDDVEYGLMPDGTRAVDAFYFYFDSNLVRESTNHQIHPKVAELFIIQAKYQNSWNEDAIIRLKSLVESCFDWNKPVSQINDIPTELKDLISLFRNACDEIMKGAVDLSVRFFFVTKSPNLISSGIRNRAEELKQSVYKTLKPKTLEIAFWGCEELLQSVKTFPSKTFLIPCDQPLQTDDGCAVAVVKLPDFATFLQNPKTGQINSNFFQSNVRDFQGDTAINNEIAETLTKIDSPDFWWLNNGVTIIAKMSDYGRGKLKIEDPEIVNGLQTSHQIFNHFKGLGSKEDERKVLVRVISTEDDGLKAKIIKATNFQNKMDELQLKSSDTVNFFILDVLKKYGFFFDRRKGQSKTLRLPIIKTITPFNLGQMVLTVFLQCPSDARSRPTKAIAQKYGSIFNDKYNPKLYATCVLLFRKVCELMDKFVPEEDINKRIRNHVATLLACEMTKSAKPTDNQLADLADVLTVGIDESIFKDCLMAARKQYDSNPEDKYSKSVEFQNEIVKIAYAKFS